MTFFPDLSQSTMVSAGSHVRAVGWLSDEHGYATGETTEEFAGQLATICANWVSCVEEIGFCIFMGCHTCELCGKFRADGNIGVPAGDLLYVAPEMIYHYVTVHKYLPPAEFIDAVMKCPTPNTHEYKQLAKPFRALQDAYHKEQWNQIVMRAAAWASANGGESAIQEAACRFLSNSCPEYVEQVRTAYKSRSHLDG